MNLKSNPLLLLARYLFPSTALVSAAYLITHNHPVFAIVFLVISLLSLPF